MTDIFDHASEREQKQREHAIAEHNRRAGLAGKTVVDSAITCRVCDDPIPDQRRKAVLGVQTCVACQAELERATKGILT